MSPRETDIALFLPALNDGGAERVFANLASSFVQKGLKVDLLLAKKEGPYLTQIPPQINIIELGGRGMIRSLGPLLAYIRTQRPGVVFSALPGPNLVAVAARLVCRYRLIITQHLAISGDRALAKSWRSKIRALCMRLFYRFADGFVCVSEGVADEFSRAMGVPRSKIAVIYNPVYDPKIRDLANENPGHPWLAVRHEKTLVSIGRLCPQKDYETLFHAISGLPVRLIVLGEGPDRAKLEALRDELGLQGCIDMPGFVQNPYAYLARADLFVLSSHFEGFGNVIVEALAVGTPVVSTDCPSGPAEILEGGKWGALVPLRDASALRAAIEKALAAPADKAALQSRAEFFSVDRAVDRYLALTQDRKS